MKLEIIALSNYADISKDGKLNIAGIFDEIYADKFPSGFVRGFLVFTVSESKPNETFGFKIIIETPTNKSVLENEISLKIGPKGKANFIAELVGMPLPEKGEYKILIKEGKTLLGSTSFSVGPATNGQAKKTGTTN